jgi:hypothetical protein
VAWVLILGFWCGRAESKHSNIRGSIMYGFFSSPLWMFRILPFVFSCLDHFCEELNAVFIQENLEKVI